VPWLHLEFLFPRRYDQAEAKRLTDLEGYLTRKWTRILYCSAKQIRFAALTLPVFMMCALSQASAAPPTAEIAKRCLHYAYITYPYKKPGAAPASGAREAYFRDCLNKDGEVPEPKPPPKSS
jgi:hypothetical protein